MIYPEDELRNSKFKDKKIQEIKTILEKQHGREFTLDEAKEAFRSLSVLARISYDFISEELKRKELLKEHPKGYHIKEGGTCIICGRHDKNIWYDQYGLKCILCQKAINDKVLPIAITEDVNRETWYSTLDLETYFNIKSADLKKYIKTSILKARTVPGRGKSIYLQVFLIKENKDVLPPKKLVKSRTVKVIHEGKEYYALESWYDFFTEKELKRLAKYRILECLKETFVKPIDRGGILIPVDGISPLLSIK